MRPHYLAIQFAKLSDFSPIITTASEKHTSFLESLGATHVLSRSLESRYSLPKFRITGGKAVEVVYDAISTEETQTAGLTFLAKGGILVLTLDSVLEEELVKQKQVKTVKIFSLLMAPWNVEILGTLFHDKVTSWLADGVIKLNKPEVLPNGLAGIINGLERMGANQISGVKLVAHPQETV